MIEIFIFIMVLITSFLQIIHIFEEIHLEAYNIIKGKVSKKKYFFAASILIILNYFVILLLYFNNPIGNYAAFYTVFISMGNALAHLSMFIKDKDKKTLGYGLPSAIPLGIAGVILLILLIQFLIS
ncbi:MAG: hypothetical protein ACFFA7_05455 [Promethearchaeota archaeon]